MQGDTEQEKGRKNDVGVFNAILQNSPLMQIVLSLLVDSTHHGNEQCPKWPSTVII